MATSDKPKDSEKDDQVITPGGPRSKELVRRIGPNEEVFVDEAGRAKVVTRSGTSPGLEKREVTMSQELVLTPGGFRHRSLVHRIEPGHALHATDGRMRLMQLATGSLIDLPEAAVPREQVPALGSGWITYAYWNNGTGNPISSFRTTWQVPPEPTTQSGQTVFLFNGIQNYGANFGILQPVLQWGTSAAGGGAFWSIASWYVTSGGQAFFTPPVPVNVGDTLFGVMTLTGQSTGALNYTSEFQGVAGTTLPVQNIAELLWCNETLEAYSINQCSDYPAAPYTALRAINIQTGSTTPTLNWTPVNSVTDCGQHTNVISSSATDGEVDIYYGAQLVGISLDKFAEYVQILFGVTNDGGGVIILNGHIIHIPPWGPGDPIFRQIADTITEMARGLGLREIARGSTNQAERETIEHASLEMTARALERAVESVRKSLVKR